MAIDSKYTNQEIRKAIVLSFIRKEPKHFIPFLLSKNVYTDSWNKTLFYKMFKSEILKSTVKNGIGEIKFSQQDSDFYNDYLQLNIYDNYHLYPRFSILFKEENEKIYLEIPCF